MLQKLRKGNGVGTHFTTYSLHALQCLAPAFPWAHNQEEATSLYDVCVQHEEVINV